MKFRSTDLTTDNRGVSPSSEDKFNRVAERQNPQRVLYPWYLCISYFILTVEIEEVLLLRVRA